VYTVAFLRGVRGDLKVPKVTARHFSNTLLGTFNRLPNKKIFLEEELRILTPDS
jgi:hypothetical protein